MANDELSQAMAQLDGEKVNTLVKQKLDGGERPMAIVQKLQEGMIEIGNKFESGDYFLSELIMGGEIMKEIMTDLEPKLAGEESESKGKVVIATVKGDIHDLGKNIVVMLLKGSGYEVIDLGVDVDSQKIVEAVKEHNAPLVGLSVLLTSCLESMKNAVQELKNSGVNTSVLIGGPIIDDKVVEYTGADHGTTVASDASKIAAKVVG